MNAGLTIRILVFLFTGLLCSFNPVKQAESEDEFFFKEPEPDQWVNLYNIPDAWHISKTEIRCTGKYSSSLRSRKIYSDFVLEFEFIPAESGTQPILIIHSDALPATGKPFPDGVIIGLSPESQFRTGELFDYKIPDADLYPPDESILKPGRITKFRVNSANGKITLTVNRKSVSRVTSGTTGFITLFSPAAQGTFRNMRIRSVSEPKRTDVQELSEFISLYNGSLLSDWDVRQGHVNHWKGLDWLIDYDGKSEEKDKCLWSKKSYRDFVLIADLRLTRKPEPGKSPVILPSGETAKNKDGSDQEVEIPYAGDTGIYLRGNSKSQVNIGNRYIGSGEIYGYRVDKNLPAHIRAAVTPTVKADRPPGDWNRFIITMKGDRVTVVLNGKTVINQAQLPGIPEKGPIALQDDHADNNTFRFANLFIRELEPGIDVRRGERR